MRKNTKMSENNKPDYDLKDFSSVWLIFYLIVSGFKPTFLWTLIAIFMATVGYFVANFLHSPAHYATNPSIWVQLVLLCTAVSLVPSGIGLFHYYKVWKSLKAERIEEGLKG